MAALPWSAAQAATTGARVFDSIKERGRLHRLTDVLLDELAIAEQVTPREL